MNRIIEFTKIEYRKLRQENAHLKNDFSVHRQKVENEIRQHKLRTYQPQNECLKNERKNNNKSNGFNNVRQYMNEKNSWKMIMMMMSLTMNMIMTKKLEIMRIRTTIRPTKMMKTIREK